MRRGTGRGRGGNGRGRGGRRNASRGGRGGGANGTGAKDKAVAASCGLQVETLLRLEASLSRGGTGWGTSRRGLPLGGGKGKGGGSHPKGAPQRPGYGGDEELLADALRHYHDEDKRRWRELEPHVCCTLRIAGRDKSSSHAGRTIQEMNEHYSETDHRSMAQDRVRVDAYGEAIRRAAAQKRVLDVGSGPFMLLGRLASNAGATKVYCVEHSRQSVVSACELMRHEHTLVKPVPSCPHCPSADAVSDANEWTEVGRNSGRRSAENSSNCALLTELGAQLALCSVEDHAEICAHRSGVSGGSRAAEGSGEGKESKEGDDVGDVYQESAGTPPTLRAVPVPVLRATVHREPKLAVAPLPTVEGALTGGALDSIELYEGLSSDAALPGGIELIVHEILGHIASSEGAVGAIRELRRRPGLAAKGCKVIPSAAGTMLAPTSVFHPNVLERLILHHNIGSTAAEVGSIYSAEGFPRECVLAPAQAMEWHDFNGELPLQQTRHLAFTTAVAGWFNGLHMHLQVQLDERETPEAAIDSWTQRTSWSTVYVCLRSANDAIWLPAGSKVACVCDTDMDNDCPEYAIKVECALPGKAMQHAGSVVFHGGGW